MDLKSRVIEMRHIRASELLPNKANWRHHPPAQEKALSSLLEEVGFAGAILARETPAGLEILDGHLRREIAVDAEIPVLICDLNDDEAEMVLATFDPLGQMAIADKEQLKALIDRLRPSGDHLKELLADLRPVGLDDISISDDSFNRAVPKRAAVGELWRLGKHRIICGSAGDETAVARLMGGQEIDLLVTSPPYAVGVAYDTFDDTPLPWADYRAFLGESLTPWVEHLAKGRALVWVVGASIKTHPHRQIALIEDLGLTLQRILVWKKVGVPVPISHHELGVARSFSPNFTYEFVALFSKGKKLTKGKEVRYDSVLRDDVFTVAQTEATRDLPTIAGAPKTGANSNLDRRASKAHPAPFPVRLPAAFIARLADRGAIVADPFLGSGTTLVASEQLGSRCIGVDISPRYIDLVISRFEKLTGIRAKKVKRHDS